MQRTKKRRLHVPLNSQMIK